jgi:hypothetical protein
MKKTLVLLSLLFAFLLSGCGNAALQRYESFAEDLRERDALSFTAELTASYPDRTAQFSLRYALEDGVQRVTVLAPERISGISARVEQGKTALEYDGLILDTGDLNEFGLSPMSALPLLVDALSHAHADAFWTEEDTQVVKLLYDDHTNVQVWFTGEMIPTHAELICEGAVTVACDIKNWS